MGKPEHRNALHHKIRALRADLIKRDSDLISAWMP